MVRRYYLCTDAARLSIFGRNYGLVQSLCGAWALSNSLEGTFCRTALQQALGKATPTIFNTDQGSQFTAHAFTTPLETAGVQISMDGRGRVFDTSFVERLCRTVTYEHLYVYDYQTGAAVAQGLDSYFQFPNTKRPHQSLGYRTPAEVQYAPYT